MMTSTIARGFCLGTLACLLTAFNNPAIGQSLPVTQDRIAFNLFGPASGTQKSAGDIDGDGREDFIEYIETMGVGGSSIRSAIVSAASGLDLDAQSFSNILSPPVTFTDYRYFRLDDLDGDGTQEYALATVMTPPLGAGQKSTTIDVYSGHPRVFRFQIQRFGLDYAAREIVPLGDVNNDGFGDFGVRAATGLAEAVIGGGLHIFECLSGLDGSVLYYLDSDVVKLDGMAAMGDIDGDGHDDFALSSGDTSLFQSGGGSATIYSGANLLPIQSWFGQQPFDRLGRDLVTLEDIDGDGMKDIAILQRGSTPTSGGPSQVLAYSSGDGSLLWQVTAPTATPFVALRGAGDLNGDGVVDLAVTTLELGGVVSTSTYSGADGQVLEVAVGGLPGLLNPVFGVGFPGDTNGDGIAETSTLEDSGAQARMIATTTHGAEAYGTPTPGSALALSWNPNSNVPQQGYIELDGAAPNANLFFGVSTAPWNGAPFGANHPLWISPLPQDLFLTASTIADGNGRFRSFDTLSKPVIAGVPLFVQAAQTTLPDAASNGLQLLYGP